VWTRPKKKNIQDVALWNLRSFSWLTPVMKVMTLNLELSAL
jgi:hypothetical protein